MTQTIVLIDDEKFTLTMLKKFLTDKGYKVLTASNGKEGLELLDDHKVDLIICDRVMPEMSGFEMLKKIREDEGVNNDIPFIFVSALGDRRDKMAAVNLNPAAYLVKPVDSDELLKTVQKVL